MARVAQETLDHTVQQAVARYREAILVNGWDVRIWRKALPRSSIRCSCTSTIGPRQEISEEGQRLDLAGDPNTNALPDDASKPAPPDQDVFDENTIDDGVYVLRGQNMRMGHQPRQRHQDEDIPDLDLREFNDLRNRGANANLEDLARQHWDAIDSIMSGAEGTACAICLGSGYIDGYQFTEGERMILDVSPNNPTIHVDFIGASRLLDMQQGGPAVAGLSAKSDAIIWKVELPSYFQRVTVLKAWNNDERLWVGRLRVRERTDIPHVENPINPPPSTPKPWEPLTIEWLNGRKGKSNKLEIEYSLGEQSFPEGQQRITHVEILIETIPLYKISFPQLPKQASFNTATPPVRAQAEVDPMVGILPQESYIENISTGTVWQVTESTMRTTAKGLVFSFDLQLRQLQPGELGLVLSTGGDPQLLARPFPGGLELVHNESRITTTTAKPIV